MLHTSWEQRWKPVLGNLCLFIQSCPVPIRATTHWHRGSTLSICHTCLLTLACAGDSPPRSVRTPFPLGPRATSEPSTHCRGPMAIRQSSRVKVTSICPPCPTVTSHLPLVCPCLQIIFTCMVLVGHHASQVMGSPSLSMRTLRLRDHNVRWGDLLPCCLVTCTVWGKGRRHRNRGRGFRVLPWSCTNYKKTTKNGLAVCPALVPGSEKECGLVFCTGYFPAVICNTQTLVVTSLPRFPHTTFLSDAPCSVYLCIQASLG